VKYFLGINTTARTRGSVSGVGGFRQAKVGSLRGGQLEDWSSGSSSTLVALEGVRVRPRSTSRCSNPLWPC